MYLLGFKDEFTCCLNSINSYYEKSFSKPLFLFSDNSIKIVLPTFRDHINLTLDEAKIFNLLSKHFCKSINQIKADIVFGKSKINKILQTLHKKGLIKIVGKGRGTKYLKLTT